MSPTPIRRTGALTERSLIDAVTTECEAGRVPSVLVVGDEETEQAALQILRDTSPLGRLRGSAPAVERDSQLGAGEWELR